MKPYAWLSIGAALTTIILKAVTRCARANRERGASSNGICCVVWLLLLPLPALAWNAGGHRLVAAVAWEYLDAHSRSTVSRLLRDHPDYPRWLAQAGVEQSERRVFIEASTWPDDIRNDGRFFSAASDAPTPLLAGFPDMERHADWHYVNRPLTDPALAPLRSTAVSGRLDEQLAVLAARLGAARTSVPERAYALPWLVHLVGDAHQPLHTTSRLDAQGEPDQLGTAATVVNPFNRRKSSSTLHAFWDDLPGPPWLRGERLDAGSRALATAHLQPRPAASSFAQWLDESWQIARDSAYPPGDEPVPTISEAFYENSRSIANRRVALAGYRLAVWLNELLGAARD